MNYEEVVDAVNKVMEEYTMRLTVRQIYYRLVSPPFQIFANTRNCYTGFDKILTKAREKGDVDWRNIEDRTRATIGGDYGYDSPESFLDDQINTLKNSGDYYTKEMWKTQPLQLEVWVEKDALATLFSEVAKGFRVITFPSRGYSSFTKVMEAIENRFIEHIKKGQQIIILHFSDHDPSGLDMGQDLMKRLKEYVTSALLDLSKEELEKLMKDFPTGQRHVYELYRCALTHKQVQQFNLASNPTKIADPRAKDYVTEFGDQCWELDAVPPDELQKIIRTSIMNFIDNEAWSKRAEEAKQERQQLRDKLKKLKITFED